MIDRIDGYCCAIDEMCWWEHLIMFDGRCKEDERNGECEVLLMHGDCRT